MSVMPATHIFQILNHYTPREALDPGFGVLDNSANVRPDWYEYWPIRHFLLNESLDEAAYYGFLSPKFEHKTNMTAAMVDDFIQISDPATDVFLFSPSIHNGSYFLNVFEHGESDHPGLVQVSKRLFQRIGRIVDWDNLVTDSRTMVYSNYFVAKPRFWREWLALFEQMFSIAETAEDDLGKALRAPAPYRGAVDVPMKIFVMERMATLILATDPRFRARARDPFAAQRRIYKLPLAVVCDALKIAYVTTGRGQYKDVFVMIRNLRKLLNMQIRIGSFIGWPGVRPALRVLQSYWRRERPPEGPA